MAIYKFKCEKCYNEKEIEIPMAEYDQQKEKQVCNCGEKMHRVIEWQGVTQLCNGCYGIDKGSGWTH